MWSVTLSLTFCGKAGKNFILVTFGKWLGNIQRRKTTISGNINIVASCNMHIKKTGWLVLCPKPLIPTPPSFIPYSHNRVYVTGSSREVLVVLTASIKTSMPKCESVKAEKLVKDLCLPLLTGQQPWARKPV